MNNFDLKLTHFTSIWGNEYFGQSTTWNNPKKYGIGLMKYANGTYYLGEFQDGIEYGLGIYYDGKDFHLGKNINRKFNEYITLYEHGGRISRANFNDGYSYPSGDDMGIDNKLVKEEIVSLFTKLKEKNNFEENDFKLIKKSFDKYKDICEKHNSLSYNEFYNYYTKKAGNIIDEDNVYAVLNSDKTKRFGFYESPNKNKYVGNFLDDKRCGFGIMYFNNGNKYIGNWNKNASQYGCEEGFGLFNYVNSNGVDTIILGKNKERFFYFPYITIKNNEINLFTKKDESYEINNPKMIENINKLCSIDYKNISDIKKECFLDIEHNFFEYKQLLKYDILNQYNYYVEGCKFTKKVEKFEQEFNKLSEKEKEYPNYVRIQKEKLEKDFIDDYLKTLEKNNNLNSFITDDLLLGKNSVSNGLRQALCELTMIKCKNKEFSDVNKTNTCFNKYFGLTGSKLQDKKHGIFWLY